MKQSKARKLYGKLAFFLNYGAVVPEEIVSKYFPAEADYASYSEIDLPKLKENLKKEKAPYNPVEYSLQVLAKAYDISSYYDSFEEAEMEDILDSFIKHSTPKNISSLYNNTPVKNEKKKAS